VQGRKLKLKVAFESRSSHVQELEPSAVNLGSTWGEVEVNLGSTWGQAGVNQGSTWGQPGVNLGSTWGQPGVKLHRRTRG